MREGVLPGYTHITDVSGAFANLGSIPKPILQNAAERGTHLHEIVKDTILNIPVDADRLYYMNRKMNGDLDKISLSGYMISFWRFWRKFEDSNVSFPDRIYDDLWMLTGEPDLITVLDGERYLIDWKFTSKSSPTWDIQANGYAMIYENAYEEVIDHMLFVRLDKDGGDPEVVQCMHDGDLFTVAFEFYEKFFKGQTCHLEME